MFSRKTTLMLLTTLFSTVAIFSGFTDEQPPFRTVRIGYPIIQGYNEIDEKGDHSGYGYEYLQHLKKYANWTFTYVDNNTDISTLLTMLDNDEIDLVSPLLITPERKEKYFFSAYPIGESGTNLVLSTKATQAVTEGDYTTYNGLRIGVVKGSINREELRNFAKKKGFSYKEIQFSNDTELHNALTIGSTIDAAAQITLHKISGNRISDTFNRKPFYFAIKKDNTKLLNELTKAQQQLIKNEQNILFDLDHRYYADSATATISFTPTEKKYIAQSKKDYAILYAVINPDSAPYSFVADGKPNGFIYDIVTEIINRTGLNIQILETRTRDEYLQTLKTKRAAICLDMHSDFNTAEKHGYTLTHSYYTATMSLVQRHDFTGIIKKVAVVKNLDAGSYDTPRFSQYRTYIQKPTVKACIDAVVNGECDAARLPDMTAQQCAYNDRVNRLITKSIPLSLFALSIAVREDINTLVPSIIDKATMSLNTSDISEISVPYILFPQQDVSFIQILLYHPFTVVGILIAIITIAVIIILLSISRRNVIIKHNALKEITEQSKRLAAVVEQEYDYQTLINLDTMQYEETTFPNRAPSYNLMAGDYREQFEHFLSCRVLPTDRDRIAAVNSPDAMLREYEQQPTMPPTLKFFVQSNSGGRRMLQTTLYFYKSEGTRYASLMHKDITAMSLQEYQGKLRTSVLDVLGNTFFGIYTVNLTSGLMETVKVPLGIIGIITESGYQYEKAITKYIDLYCKESAPITLRKLCDIETLKKTLEEKKVIEITYKSNNIQWITLRIYHGSGDTVETGEDYAILIFENATEKAEIQENLRIALQAAQLANQAKSLFLSNMSHDIRTPMNAIIGMTGIATAHLDNKERVKDALGKISQASQHLLGIINNILDMSRIESGKMKIADEEVNLEEVIHSMLMLIQPQIKTKNQQIFVDTTNIRNELVISDKTRLMQIFINILSNSIKFTPNNGIIGIRISQSKNAPEGYGTYDFIFSDNGIGISEKFQKSMFEAFERDDTIEAAKIEGTGLGLAITKNIISLMGGTISCKSKINQGTTITISLPFKLHEGPENLPNVSSLVNIRALIVDDDTNTCTSITSMLNEISMRPDWTLSGHEAVARAEVAVNAGDPYSVFIIDWLMPDLNGIETVRQIRRIVDDQIPIFILTAYDWSDIETEAKAAGVSAFLEKPLFRSNLYSVLHRVITPGEEEEDKKKKKHRNFTGNHVLIVEDQAINLEIAKHLVESTGASVDTAENGAIAIQKIEASPEHFYGLVFMDIRMPIMNGYDATQAIRKLQRADATTLPIVAMSANAFKEDQEKSLDCGMNGHLSKPINVEEVYNVMSQYLNEAPQES